MIRHKLTSLLSPLYSNSRARLRNFSDVEVSDISCHSKEVKQGTIFVAICGTIQDGHNFIKEAIQRKASAIVVEKDMPLPKMPRELPVIVVDNARKSFALLCTKFYDYPSHKMNVIGITGTNGKTTTSYLLKSMLEASGEKTGLISTIKTNLNETVVSNLTTPTAKEIQSELTRALKSGLSSMVIEVTSHALDQFRVYGTRFRSGIFTNLSHEHLDYHKSIEQYKKAKGLLFEMLPQDGFAILNYDHPASAYFSQITEAKVVTYGLCRGADVRAEVYNVNFSGTEFTITYNGTTRKICSKLIGIHNIYNILAAASCLFVSGCDFKYIIQGIEAVKNIPGRLELLENAQPYRVLIDYAHTPDALYNVLSILREMTKGRLIVVFGCGGDRDKSKRPKMGMIAQEFADLSVLTSDNPRSEDPICIVEEIKKGFTQSKRYLVEPDREAAIKRAISMAKKDDVILIAGKGHEKFQIFKDRIVPFDDKKVATEALKSRC